MGRIAERLREGAPPLRVSELSRLTGWSRRGIQKLMEAGSLAYDQPAGDGGERRVPVAEALRAFPSLSRSK